LEKTNSDSTSKRSRIPPVFPARTNPNEKKVNTTLKNSVGVLSSPQDDSSGPWTGGGASGNQKIGADHLSNESTKQNNVVASLAPHTSTAMPLVSYGLSTESKASTINSLSNVSTSSSSPSSTAKQFLTRRVRSHSKTDNQSVTDKSLFSRFFPKKPKKTVALITTNVKSIDVPLQNKRAPLINQMSLSTNDQQSTIDEEENEQDDDDNDEQDLSGASLSDDDQHQTNKNSMGMTRSSTTSRSGSRTNSGNTKNSSRSVTPTTLSASDSQYYASMSAAPRGFSISYHKCMSKGNDNLRKQAALGRIQQQNKQTNVAGTTQLMSLFQDPKRTTNQSPTPMSGITQVKTFSGQTIITRTDSADRPPTYCIRSSSMSPTHDADDTFVSDDEIYTHFMKNHTCYDIMPKSSKLVIFDTQLAVKKAFFALVYNGVRAAPLWDTKRQRFVGMLTITDFILILQKYYKEPHAKIEELEEHRIETWREVLREYEKPLLCIRPNDSLFDAIRILIDNHVHRLPIIDSITNNVIFILTHKRILRFFYLYIYDWPQPAFMSKTLEELNVGTYDNMHIIEEDTTIIEALNVFVKYRVSALPVVDKNRRLVNVYSKFDVIGLAADKTYRNLNMTISEALSFRKERSESVAKCYKHETLSVCMERIVKAEVHRLVVVDNDEHAIGVLSLSDLLDYIVIRPTKFIATNSSTPTTPVPDDDLDEK